MVAGCGTHKNRKKKLYKYLLYIDLDVYELFIITAGWHDLVGISESLVQGQCHGLLEKSQVKRWW